MCDRRRRTLHRTAARRTREPTKRRNLQKHRSSLPSVRVTSFAPIQVHELTRCPSLIGCYAVWHSVCTASHRITEQNEAADTWLTPIFRKTFKYPWQEREMFIFSLALAQNKHKSSRFLCFRLSTNSSHNSNDDNVVVKVLLNVFRSLRFGSSAFIFGCY